MAFSPDVSGQRTLYPSFELFEYAIVYFDDHNFINKSESDSTWNFADLIVQDNVPLDIASSKRTLPVFGEVQINNKKEIESLLIKDVLGGYKSYNGKLSIPFAFQPSNERMTTGYTLSVDINELPERTLTQLPIIPDSLRIKLTAEYVDSELSNAKALLPGQQIGLNYFSRKINITQTVEVQIGPFNWESVEEIAPMINWDESYSVEQGFIIHPDFEMPIVIMERRMNGSSIGFLRPKNKTITKALPMGLRFEAIPNPAINNLRFSLDNLEVGPYKISIKNILGKLLLEMDVNYNRSDYFPLDVSQLNKGSYFYSLEDANGNILSTKRLIILRP